MWEIRQLPGLAEASLLYKLACQVFYLAFSSVGLDWEMLQETGQMDDLLTSTKRPSLYPEESFVQQDF